MKSTTLDPARRRALRVVLDAETEETIKNLMGKDPGPAFLHFIMEQAKETSQDQLDV